MATATHRIFCLLVCFIMWASVPMVRAADLIIYTEDYPPYNFADTNGVVVGEATERVRKIMHEAGLSYDIRLMPWVRAEKLASLKPDAMIYSMAFSRERSARYDWIAPLAMPDMRLFARKSLQDRVTYDDIREGRFTALCVETDASCGILKRVGFPAGNLIQASAGGASEPLMVHYGRADMFLGDMNLHPYREYLFGIAAKEMKSVLAVEGDLVFYLAAGLQVSADLRNRVKAAHERLLSRGEIDIFRRPEIPPDTAQK